MKKENKTYRVKKVLSSITSSVADCMNCEWRAETKNAVGLAAIHTKHTGHKTIVETAMATHFEGR